MQYFSQDKNRAGSKQRRGLPTNQRKTKREDCQRVKEMRGRVIRGLRVDTRETGEKRGKERRKGRWSKKKHTTCVSR